MVVPTPVGIRKHSENVDRMAIAKRCTLRRLETDESDKTTDPTAPIFARPLHAAEEGSVLIECCCEKDAAITTHTATRYRARLGRLGQEGHRG